VASTGSPTHAAQYGLAQQMQQPCNARTGRGNRFPRPVRAGTMHVSHRQRSARRPPRVYRARVELFFRWELGSRWQSRDQGWLRRPIERSVSKIQPGHRRALLQLRTTKPDAESRDQDPGEETEAERARTATRRSIEGHAGVPAMQAEERQAGAAKGRGG